MSVGAYGVFLIVRDVLFHQINEYKNSNIKFLINGLYDNKCKINK
jgi:hypothetical protein